MRAVHGAAEITHAEWRAVNGAALARLDQRTRGHVIDEEKVDLALGASYCVACCHVEEAIRAARQGASLASVDVLVVVVRVGDRGRHCTLDARLADASVVSAATCP